MASAMKAQTGATHQIPTVPMAAPDGIPDVTLLKVTESFSPTEADSAWSAEAVASSATAEAVRPDRVFILLFSPWFPSWNEFVTEAVRHRRTVMYSVLFSFNIAYGKFFSSARTSPIWKKHR